MLSSLPWTDGARVAVLGQQYGASLATLLLARSSLPLCGVATSPVADWRKHDAPQAEMYLGRPADNYREYQVLLIVHLPVCTCGGLLTNTGGTRYS